MKILGIDYGSKRVGIALSDEGARFALPHSVLANSKSLVADIVKIADDNTVQSIVVGDSNDYHGQPNAIMAKITPFVAELKQALGLPIHMQPEFMTSHQAEHFQGKHAMLDASAAAIILQSYLDSHRHTHDNVR